MARARAATSTITSAASETADKSVHRALPTLLKARLHGELPAELATGATATTASDVWGTGVVRRSGVRGRGRCPPSAGISLGAG